MHEELVVYHTMRSFHNWFSGIANVMSDAPFQSVVQNYMYYPDPNDIDKSRLETFVRGLIEFIDNARSLPNPTVLPKSFEVKGVTIDE